MSSGEAVSGTTSLPVVGSPSRLLPALLAVVLGVSVLGVVGFAPVAALHNAAHDTRHSAAFPCH